MGVSTLQARSIKGFAFEFACSCPVWIGLNRFNEPQDQGNKEGWSTMTRPTRPRPHRPTEQCGLRHHPHWKQHVTRTNRSGPICSHDIASPVVKRAVWTILLLQLDFRVLICFASCVASGVDGAKIGFLTHDFRCSNHRRRNMWLSVLEYAMAMTDWKLTWSSLLFLDKSLVVCMVGREINSAVLRSNWPFQTAERATAGTSFCPCVLCKQTVFSQQLLPVHSSANRNHDN